MPVVMPILTTADKLPLGNLMSPFKSCVGDGERKKGAGCLQGVIVLYARWKSKSTKLKGYVQSPQIVSINHNALMQCYLTRAPFQLIAAAHPLP